MSENFKSFVRKSLPSLTPEAEKEFVSGLRNSSGTADGLARITNAVFEVANSLFENEHDKAILESVKKMVLATQTTVLQPVPKVKEALFFPSETNEQRLVQQLNTAQHSLLVCVFTITNNALRDAVIRAHDRGVQVRVISDDECMNQQGSDIYDMKAYGIPCKSDTDPAAHMHNKFVVIDSQVLITGSFNWTVAASNRNQENLVFLYDTDLSQRYTEEFDRLWESFVVVESAGHSTWTEGQKGGARKH
jgi:hypothetical protein